MIISGVKGMPIKRKPVNSPGLRVWKSITHWNWRTDLGQIWSIRLSKTASVDVTPFFIFVDDLTSEDFFEFGIHLIPNLSRT